MDALPITHAPPFHQSPRLLNHHGFLSPLGPIRMASSSRYPSISFPLTPLHTNFQALPLHGLSPCTKMHVFSTDRSSNGSLTDKISCKPDATHDETELLLKKRAKEIVTEMRGTCIFLIGMMGSGKTTVGKVLAEALGYHFLDSDKLIEEAAGGASVAQIFREQNEDNFRDAETEVLKQLSCRGHLVVATGGGIVVRPMNWSYLRHGITVWLDVPVDALAERVVAVGTESRPLLGLTEGDTARSQAFARLLNIFEVRGPFYADADAKVSLQQMALCLGYQDVSALTPTMIALQAFIHSIYFILCSSMAEHLQFFTRTVTSVQAFTATTVRAIAHQAETVLHSLTKNYQLPLCLQIRDYQSQL